MPETISDQTFQKPAISVQAQINLLKERGLKFKNEELAAKKLTFIGYYHFSIYALPFQYADHSENHHNFIRDISFEDILNIYEFDRKLRLLVIDALERIEIGFKSLLINEMGVLYGPFWYMNEGLFAEKFDHAQYLSEIRKEIGYGRPAERMRDLCIRHYYTKYNDPAMPPIWMVFECLSFGRISHLYSGLIHVEQKRLADHLDLPVPAIKSWLHSLNYVRNLCAHHSRLWNRIFTIKPAKLKELCPDEFEVNTKFYAQAAAIWILLQKIEPETNWALRLYMLFEEYPDINKFSMGFRQNMTDNSFWKLQEQRL